MDIEFKGANCIVLNVKGETVVVDPKLSLVGLKDVVEKSGVVVATQDDFVVQNPEALIVNGPGEYETKNVVIKGIAAKRMIDHDDSQKATAYRIDMGDVAVAVVGHINVPLTEQQQEDLGVIDILVVPVGGNGYTLDAHQAVSIVRELDPKVVIPTHYADKALSYEVPQMELEAFIKELGADHQETAKYKIKNGSLPEQLTVMEITRTS